MSKAAWRQLAQPQPQGDAALDIRFWRRMAREAEASCLPFVFLADGIAMRSNGRDEQQLSYDSHIDVFEPLTLLAALSAVTERLGFIAGAWPAPAGRAAPGRRANDPALRIHQISTLLRQTWPKHGTRPA